VCLGGLGQLYAVSHFSSCTVSFHLAWDCLICFLFSFQIVIYSRELGSYCSAGFAFSYSFLFLRALLRVY
ncbi:hypothetical protein BDV06DRAFT_192677, partial [Aspergillus oleicola]